MKESRFFLFRAVFFTCAFFSAFIFGACKGGVDEEVSAPVVFSASNASPGKAAPGLEGYRIAYYEAAAGVSAEGNVQESDEPFTITDYGPFGDLPSEIKRPSIYVVFSQPVVPLSKLGEPIREDAGFFTIEPPLEGVYRWYGSRLLSFEPDADSMPQHEYRVTVSDSIKSLGGKSLEGERSFSFETERLGLLEWDLGTGENWVSIWDADPLEAKSINLVFSYPVNLDEIGKWIEVRTAEDTYAFTVSRFPETGEKRYASEQGVRLTLAAELPQDTDITVRLLKGARSEAGFIGTKEDADYSFHTIRPFRLDTISARASARPRTEQSDTIPLTLRFSHTLDPEIAPSLFSVEGMPALSEENIRVYGSTVIIYNLPLEYERAYRVTVSGEVKDIYGRRLGSGQTFTARAGRASSYVYSFNTGARMLEAGFPPKIVWEAQNPLSLKFSMARASGPYERLPLLALETFDVSTMPQNSKSFFFEDLSPFLGPGGKGSAALAWEYETRSEWQPDRINRQNTWLTVQVTDIGITTRYAWNKVLVWATKLSTGEPLSGAKAELMEGASVIREGTTDSRGLAVFEFLDGEFVSLFTELPGTNFNDRNWTKGFRIRVTENGGAMAGGDQAEFIPNDSHNLWRFDVEAVSTPFAAEAERLLVFLFTDRGLYKPGETVTFRGIDRSLSSGRFAPYTGAYKIEVSTGASDAPVIASLSGLATANGGSHGSFTLPETLDPGDYVIRYVRTDDRGTPLFSGRNIPQERSIPFTVANFEALRFEARLRFPELTFYKGEKISARLDASYLSGGGLSGAPYTWYWSREPAAFNPGGSWQYWHIGPETYYGRDFIDSGEGTLGPDGSGDISHNPGADGVEGAPYRYRLEASVQDPARQEISARAAVIVHPASFYIASRLDTGTFARPDSAARPSAWFLEAASPATLSWALLDPSGSFFESSGSEPEITFRLIRHDWKQSRQAGVGGRINLNWEMVEETVMEQTVRQAAGEHSGVIAFTPQSSGQYEVRLSGKDSSGRSVFTSYGFYVTGSGWVHWGASDADSITLTPDKTMYALGETAKLLVQSPLPSGRYLLTIERESIIEESIIELDGSALTIDIPVKESYVPVVYVAIASYTARTGPPSHTYYEPDLDKPKGLFGLAAIHVDNESRHYKIEIINSKSSYRPAEEAEVTLKVSLNGRPASGVELSFMAVDRGVVDLIDYHVPDPLAFFYDPANFPLGVSGADSRSLLIDPVTYSITDLQGGDEEGSKIEERKDFRPTAVFEPYLVTGPDGTVKVRFTLPDSLTTYRCTAVASGLSDFGISENDLRVSAPLTALAALPRKLRWRDTGTVSLVLTNLSDNAVEASVSLETETVSRGLWDTVLEVDGENEKNVTIAAGSSAEVPFALAALGAGQSRLIFTLRSPEVNERIIRLLDVDRPVLYETVTAIGNLGNDNPFIEEGVVLPSLAPDGSLSVSLSASRLAMLKEAVRYLLDYPYGCLEQITAKLLPLIAFADHLESFNLESPVEDPKSIVEGGLENLARSQLQNGSFPYWPGGSSGDAYVSLRVAHILHLAKQKGYAVPASVNTQVLLGYIANLDKTSEHFRNDPFLKGYSLWIRAMYGERIGTEISTYLRRGDEPGISGWSFAGLAALELGMEDLAVSTRDRVRRFIRPGTRTLDLTDTYERRGNYWGGDSDRYALALMLYHALNPEDDMTTRLASSLIERQRRGIWNNTSSSYWALLAFGRIAGAEQKEISGAGLLARLSLGGTPLFEAAFDGYGGVPASQTLSLAEMVSAGMPVDTVLPLRIEREGTGRLYYTASLKYGIPAELALPRDEGLGVYAETFDSEGNPVSGGILEPGKTYTRRVTVSTSRDRTFVALRAPVPSGAEIVDAAFVTSSTVPPKEEDEAGENHWRPREIPPVRFVMDDELRFHWDYFPTGKREVEFRFRAVMPGIYPTPPPQAECMYEAEVFGRGKGELYRIVGE